jgi:GNAT superfamily N-acetyltransferase
MAHADDDVRRYWADVLLPTNDVWVALDDESGDIVAVMAMEDDWLDQLYVLPGWTNRGIGSDLLNIAKRECSDGLRLWAFQSNVNAHRFYERHGFVEVERTDGLDNEERSPDVKYAWLPR